MFKKWIQKLKKKPEIYAIVGEGGEGHIVGT